MNAIELKKRDNPNKKVVNDDSSKKSSSSSSSTTNTKSKFQLNPLRTSAIGFVIEDKIEAARPPMLNKNSKPNRHSVMTIDNDEQWIEYIDENNGKPYYHNVISNVVQWEKPKELLFQN